MSLKNYIKIKTDNKKDIIYINRFPRIMGRRSFSNENRRNSQRSQRTGKEVEETRIKRRLVPTMGYLHEGHKSLMEAARKDNDKVVVSIFVNPMQFGPTEDLATYPRDLDHDAALCESVGVDLIFHPEAEEMYEKDFCSFVDMTGLTEGLCGKTRPIHFRGVCTVVNKLFNIVTPDHAYFGQKDGQQLAVIKTYGT